MVKTAPFLLALTLGGAALAQDAGTPPAVSPEAPALSQGDAPAETPPLLPGTGSALAPADAAPAAAPPVAAPALHMNTDLVSLVRLAHPVVQAVMALLTLSVFAVLTILFFKTVEFTLAFRALARTTRALAEAPGATPPDNACPLAHAARAARDELGALPPRLTADLRTSARERLDLQLARIEAAAVLRLRSGTGLLASIGAVAPFVGLFGTVFGIMNSFLAIADTQTTNLAVVAPGIAEALLATGIGLVAAIPAVLLYNHLMRRIAAFRHNLADGTALVLRRFSHDLDARMGAAALGA
jgi:biopolymer transport protein ExbB